MNKYEIITSKELKTYFDNKKDFILLDIREQFEVNIASIPNSMHIPMMEIPNRIQELDRNKEIVVICKSGIRSSKVCEFLYRNNK